MSRVSGTKNKGISLELLQIHMFNITSSQFTACFQQSVRIRSTETRLSTCEILPNQRMLLFIQHFFVQTLTILRARSYLFLFELHFHSSKLAFITLRRTSFKFISISSYEIMSHILSIWHFITDFSREIQISYVFKLD